jgi:hypothetical protein
MTTKRGGSRPGSGRKHTYGTLPTKRIARTVPVAWVEELDEWLTEKRSDSKNIWVNTDTDQHKADFMVSYGHLSDYERFGIQHLWQAYMAGVLKGMAKELPFDFVLTTIPLDTTPSPKAY